MLIDDEYSAADHTAPHMTARQVLDVHADLHRLMSNMTPTMREQMERYGRVDASLGPWAASHLHPATDLRDLGPWIASLGDDLFGATPYQVTEEMIDLAEALTITTPDLADIVEEDLPSDWGFMWFDRPIPRPSVGDKPGQQQRLMQAVSWARVPRVPIDIRVRVAPEGSPLHKEGPPEEAIPGSPVKRVWAPAVRIREWGWLDDPTIAPRPLHLIGQSTVVLTPHVQTPLTHLHLVHMIWILMEMEIVGTTAHRTDRAGFRRAANLKHHDVHVVTLRRQRHDPQTIRHVDWTCTWLVRGHWRKAPNGGTFGDGRTRTWIRPHIKGPEGLPLRAHDILYKLSR